MAPRDMARRAADHENVLREITSALHLDSVARCSTADPSDASSNGIPRSSSLRHHLGSSDQTKTG